MYASRKPNLSFFDMTGAFADPIQGSDVPLLPCRATTSVALRDIIVYARPCMLFYM